MTAVNAVKKNRRHYCYAGWQAAAPSQNEAEESDATEEAATRERTTRVGRPRGGMKVAARSGERLRTKRDRKRRTPKGGRRLAHHTPLLKFPVWWRRAVLPSLPRIVLVFFLSLRGLAKAIARCPPPPPGRAQKQQKQTGY